jgi:hypothetical protein
MGRIVGSLDGNWNGNGTWESGLGWVVISPYHLVEPELSLPTCHMP